MGPGYIENRIRGVYSLANYKAVYGNLNKRPMGHNSLTCIFANAMQQSSSIAIATRTQIWPYHKKVKGYLSLIILTKLVDLESPMLYTKIQPQSFLSTGEEDF